MQQRNSITSSSIKKSKLKPTLREGLSLAPKVDVTDTVALLTPHIEEVDLWPAAHHKIQAAALGSGADDASEDAVGSELSANASVFLKEAKSIPSLRFIENAMCDMRYAVFMFLISG